VRVNQPDGQTGPLIGVPPEKAQIEEGWHDEVFGIEGRAKEVGGLPVKQFNRR
jgi:hypothetical protein